MIQLYILALNNKPWYSNIDTLKLSYPYICDIFKGHEGIMFTLIIYLLFTLRIDSKFNLTKLKQNIFENQ